MFYRDELLFLCETLKKSHVPAATIEQKELERRLTEGESDYLFGGKKLQRQLPALQPRTVYKLTDRFERSFRFVLLDGVEIPTVLCVGPYLSATLSTKRLLEIGEINGISPQKQRYLSEYYSGLPIVPENSPLFTMLHVFCEKMWKSPSFATEHIAKDSTVATPISLSMQDREANDTLLNIKAMEMRYSFENEILRAVTLGQPHMEDQLRSAFSGELFEKRASDPLRNAKNYCIIMNTLLRKAAEKGGVHPLYLDQISSEFAHKIEHLPSLAENTELMTEMFRTYCRLVRKHSLKHFPLVVQKAILMIDADLSADLSPKKLAESQDITPGYLSTVFKKVTGQTVSSYIRTRRMEYAEYLLRTTALQIQTVAMHCGILDVQYFSKLFKSHTGKTPSEYRLRPDIPPAFKPN